MELIRSAPEGRMPRTSFSLDFRRSIMMSCNTYYCYVFRAILDNPKYEIIRDSFTKWKEYVESFGFGMKLNTDIPPRSRNYAHCRMVRQTSRQNRWRSLSIISLAIGQVRLVPHLCIWPIWQLRLPIAAGVTPHLQKEMPDNPIDPRFKERHYTMVDTSWFEVWWKVCTLPSTEVRCHRTTSVCPGSKSAERRVRHRIRMATTTRYSSALRLKMIRRLQWQHI